MTYLNKKEEITQIHVAAGIICREGHYLITQRLPEVHFALYWEFPGGKKHPDESLEDCLGREIKEELGVEIKVGEPLTQVSYQYEERLTHLYFFWCRIISGEPRKIGCYDMKWVKPEELKSYRFPPADEEILEYLSQNILERE